jgi:anti-sigma factor RsiW
MKTCREIVAFLDRYLAGDLPPSEREVFERHTRGCPPCLEYLESYRTTVALATDAGEADGCPAMPEELVRAILEARHRGAEPA